MYILKSTKTAEMENRVVKNISQMACHPTMKQYYSITPVPPGSKCSAVEDELSGLQGEEERGVEGELLCPGREARCRGTCVGNEIKITTNLKGKIVWES